MGGHVDDVFNTQQMQNSVERAVELHQIHLTNKRSVLRYFLGSDSDSN